MMQRGGRPWLRANRMACSSVTLRVQLQQNRGGEKKPNTKVRLSLHTVQIYAADVAESSFMDN